MSGRSCRWVQPPATSKEEEKVPWLGPGQGVVWFDCRTGPDQVHSCLLSLSEVREPCSLTCLALARGEREGRRRDSWVEVERNQGMETPRKQSDPRSDRCATAVEETDGRGFNRR